MVEAKISPEVVGLADVKAVKVARSEAKCNEYLAAGWELHTIMPIAVGVPADKEAGINAHVRKGIAFILVDRR